MLRVLRIVADVVFPADCDVCDRPLPIGHASSLCAPCRGDIPAPADPVCFRCGVPLRGRVERCIDCERHPPVFTTARAAGLYLPAAAGLNPLTAAVLRLKYRGRRGLAAALGEVLAARYPFAPDAVLVPVPLHPTRLRQRGFNQALLLARALGRRRSLAVAARALARTRATAAQPGLGAVARRTNLTGAFAVREPAAVRDRHVVLVDDVLTTGATADACAAALLGAGARRVDVYTVGRAP